METNLLESLLTDPTWTELLVNAPDEIWLERQGRLEKTAHRFEDELDYRNALEWLGQETGCFVTMDRPAADGAWRGCRVHWVHESLTGRHPLLSLRRHPDNPWTLERLVESDWCTTAEAEELRRVIDGRHNFLVIGSTGSGKTSVLNALLKTMPVDERVGLIEDSDELRLPNAVSFKLLTRHDPQKLLTDIDQGELLKRCLRLRPDRLVLGEIRSVEAKDFLMALSTGHAGSFGSLHASDPRQALIRLEMLIQMGAPQWTRESLRQLLRLSLQNLIVTEKDARGGRRFKGLYEIASLEETGFLLERLA